MKWVRRVQRHIYKMQPIHSFATTVFGPPYLPCAPAIHTVLLLVLMQTNASH